MAGSQKCEIRICYVYSFIIVPRIGPPNFSGVNISSYDLQLNWSRIPNDGWQGVPLGYTILYRETNADVSTWNSSVVNDKNSLSNIIPNLTAYTNYTIRIAGFTIKGNGNFTKDIVVSTAEDGNPIVLMIIVLILSHLHTRFNYQSP